MHTFKATFSVEGLLSGERYMRKENIVAISSTEARKAIKAKHPTATKIVFSA